MEKLIWQKFILGCENIDNALKKGLGGVIFFTKDIESEHQFKTLINEIKTKSLIQPFLSIDQEGGRVERTENIRPKRLSARQAYQNGEVFLEKQSSEISKELADWGINLNFAPCIDVNTNPNNPIIGERSFSEDPEAVIKASGIFINASRKYNVIPCVKHYPGHGDADKDSHLFLPKINLTLDEMEKTHIKPFKEAIRNNIEMIMVAHLHCTCFDKEVIPTSISKNAIAYLRNKLCYHGIIISDDMFMNGIKDCESIDAVIKGTLAGVDMFIFRKSDDKTLKMIEDFVNIVKKDSILQEKIKESYERILKLKNKYKIL